MSDAKTALHARRPSKLSTDKTTFSEQQMAFIRYWAQGESITSAFKRAGYKDNGRIAYSLVKRPAALAIYEREKAKFEEAAQMTRKKVMDMLVEAYDSAKLLAEPASMVAAAREIGKMCGYYAPTESRVKVDVSGNVVVQRLNTMSDAELIEMISKGTQPQLENAAD